MWALPTFIAKGHMDALRIYQSEIAEYIDNPSNSMSLVLCYIISWLLAMYICKTFHFHWRLSKNMIDSKGVIRNRKIRSMVRNTTKDWPTLNHAKTGGKFKWSIGINSSALPLAPIMHVIHVTKSKISVVIRDTHVLYISLNCIDILEIIRLSMTM